jgi:hypothetical protein
MPFRRHVDSRFTIASLSRKPVSHGIAPDQAIPRNGFGNGDRIEFPVNMGVIRLLLDCRLSYKQRAV